MNCKMRSIRFLFQKGENGYEIKEAVASTAIAPFTDSISEQKELTGTWAELLDGNGGIIYRKHLHAMLHAISQEQSVEQEQFILLLPYLPAAKTLKLYAPPQQENGKRKLFGKKSKSIGEFPIPTFPLDFKQIEQVLPSDICEEGRGRVLRKTLIKNTGNPNAYALVILAEKFGKNQDTFIAEAANCINFLYSRPPFDTIIGYKSINIWLVEIETYDKDKPYFHVDYKFNSTHVDWKLENVTKVCDALFENRSWNYAAIIINDITHDLGTRRGNQFAIALFDEPVLLRSTPESVFQHEFGHAVFGLADEYEEKAEPYTGAEPNAPNVTISHNRDTLKWRAFLEDTTPVPTPKSFYDNNKDKVGCYEGGYLYKHGIYRSQYVCVMRNQRDRDVNGYYCKVCRDHAQYVLSRTIDTHIPVPGVLYYSNSSKKWENIKIAANTAKVIATLYNYDHFQDLLKELNLGGTSKENVQALFRLYNITINEGVILPTENDGSERLGTWFIKNGDEKIYYIIMNSMSQKTLITIGSVIFPDFLDMKLFDGVSIGLEQHIFCLIDGKLQHGIMLPTGKIENFVQQQTSGLEQDLEGISVSYKTGKAAIYVAVMSKHKVKLGAYLLSTSSWDSCGFIEMPDLDGKSYEFVKIMNIENYVYVLVKNEDAVVLRIFDPIHMEWKIKMIASLDDSRSVLQGDWVYYQNKAYVIYIKENFQVISKSVGLQTDSIKVSDCCITSGTSSFQGVIMAFGTTVKDNTLHLVYTSNQKVMHAAFQFIFNYTLQQYELVYKETKEISVAGFKDMAIQSFSMHNNDSVIYLILSCNKEIED